MTAQNILLELAHYTEAGEHTKFQLLRNWQEYRFTCRAKMTLKILTKTLRATANKTFKGYCKAVAAGNADLNKLLAYKYTVKILNFYVKELEIITNMVYEYEAYLMEGHLLDSFFGEQRSIELMWDHRGL